MASDSVGSECSAGASVCLLQYQLVVMCGQTPSSDSVGIECSASAGVCLLQCHLAVMHGQIP